MPERCTWSRNTCKFTFRNDWFMHVGLRIPGDQRQITPALPLHLVDMITVGDGVWSFADASGNNQSHVEVWSFYFWNLYIGLNVNPILVAFAKICSRHVFKEYLSSNNISGQGTLLQVWSLTLFSSFTSWSCTWFFIHFFPWIVN